MIIENTDRIENIHKHHKHIGGQSMKLYNNIYLMKLIFSQRIYKNTARIIQTRILIYLLI